jgi:hypothetical protein
VLGAVGPLFVGVLIGELDGGLHLVLAETPFGSGRREVGEHLERAGRLDVGPEVTERDAVSGGERVVDRAALVEDEGDGSLTRPEPPLLELHGVAGVV